MKALRCNRFGPPSELSVEEVSLPPPGATEVLVGVRAAGVNFPDALIIQGKYQIRAEPPFTPGGELSGTVLAVGSEVSRFSVGQAIIGFTGWGAFAEQALVDEQRLIALPQGIPFVIAGSFLMTYGTAYHALVDRAALQPGEWVLVLGAGGGIGLASIEIAKAMGARVVAAASSPEKLEACREHGAYATIDYMKEDLRDQIRTLTGGHGIDVVCDPVGGPFSELALRSLAWRGRHLVIGFADGEIPRVPINLPLLKGCALVGVFWGDFVRREPQRAEDDLRELATWYVDGKINPHVSMRCTLRDTPSAIQAIMQRKLVGKAVVEL